MMNYFYMMPDNFKGHYIISEELSGFVFEAAVPNIDWRNKRVL